jgi:hypothetical protein|tara:strand:- start:3930 stop:4976 length:1047 start_codon:yes stop_codon:yes gene_type:complete
MSSSNNYNYSFFSKIFHKLVLNSNEILAIFFEIEKKLFLKKTKRHKTKSLFITGLARSGSTILLKSLYDNGAFGTLKYSDMPFITAPNLWSKINFFQKITPFKKERLHMDGIKINETSPEAFEEIFWESQLNNSLSKKILIKDDIYNNVVIENFENFISLITFKENKNIYLSKNNSNISRIDVLNKKIRNKKILILFRNPVDQCYSLWKQHINLIKLQQADNFILDYMNMLCHYEFGLGHKPFLLSSFKPTSSPLNVVYWMEYWFMIYSNLLQFTKNDNQDIAFLSYEKLTNSPELTIVKILKMMDINIKNYKNEIHNKKNYSNNLDLNKDIVLKANRLYEELKKNEI